MLVVTRRYEMSVWTPMMERIHAVLEEYSFDFLSEERVVHFRDIDTAMDAAHQAFVQAKRSYVLSSMSREEWFGERAVWSERMAVQSDNDKLSAEFSKGCAME